MPAGMEGKTSLEIEGIGRLTVRADQDPADVIENFAKQALEAGLPMTGDGMKQMMQYFCSKKAVPKDANIISQRCCRQWRI